MNQDWGYLYEKYYSQYKISEYIKIQSQLTRTWQYWDRKFLPFFKEINPNSEILELGCGIGLFIQYLKNSGFDNVLGIDISSEQVHIAQNQKLPVMEADALEYLDNMEEKYDAIIAIDFIEHFPKQMILQLFNKINHSLKKGGIFIIQTPNGQGLFPNQVIFGDFTHHSIFTMDSLQYLLKVSGFNKFHFIETGPIPRNYIGRIRVILWVFIKALANLIRVIETGKTQAIWTENIICVCYKI